MVSLKISMRPEGVASGWPSGSFRKSCSSVLASAGGVQPHHAALHEGVEIRQVVSERVATLSGLFVDRLQPSGLVATFGEGCGKIDGIAVSRTQPTGQFGKYPMIVARMPIGFSRPTHGKHVAVARRGREVISLQTDRCWQQNVGVLRQRRPERFMNDNGFDPPPCPAQAIEILMVVKRIAAGPVDQPRIGITQPPAIVIERFARMQQHVADPRHGYEAVDGIAAGRQGSPRQMAAMNADTVDRPQPKSKAGALFCQFLRESPPGRPASRMSARRSAGGSATSWR